MSSVLSDIPSVPIPEPDLTPKEIIARAEALVPMLRAQQDEAEERGYYSEAVHQEFLKAGFYRMTQPRRFGGYEFSLKTYLKTMITIAPWRRFSRGACGHLPRFWRRWSKTLADRWSASSLRRVQAGQSRRAVASPTPPRVCIERHTPR